MTKFKVGDIVQYVFSNLEGQSERLDKSTWKVWKVGVEKLFIICINGAKSNNRPGDKEALKHNRFILIESKTKEELICDKIKDMAQRHKVFIERRDNGTPNTQGTMSTMF